ncbi:hypothetical protein MtrunA17_Chr6g0449631 [Medicago truncatula]|uniref:Uncharacterized protein n=1 Tax=Medicago truncatula TaxID=3880 RepID=A0A396HB09_MEDTR|nr:hypothetical protein MtrunA17_Chr6g0449631 [Medicago truncatula]
MELLSVTACVCVGLIHMSNIGYMDNMKFLLTTVNVWELIEAIMVQSGAAMSLWRRRWICTFASL